MYNWKDINFPLHKEDWNTFEKNIKSIALNNFYVPYNTKQIMPAYISKYSCDRKNQTNLLMISNGKKWHYLATKSIPMLFRGITSTNNGDFYCLNCFSSFRKKNALESRENVWRDNEYCCIEIPNKENNILMYSPGGKFMKILFSIYGDFESVLEEIGTCSNDPKKSSTTKIVSTHLLVFLYLLIVRLIKQKISLIIIETKIV